MSKFTLTLTAGGGAELLEDEDVVWCSADDESFRDEFPDELLTESDVENILDYLVDEDFLTEDEANTVEVEEESHNGDDSTEDTGDDDDDL